MMSAFAAPCFVKHGTQSVDPKQFGCPHLSAEIGALDTEHKDIGWFGQAITFCAIQTS